MVARIHNIKLVAFNLDGTLIDSMPCYSAMAAQVLWQYYGMEASAAKQAYYSTSGISFSHQLEILFPGNAQNAAAAQDFEQQKIDYLEHHGFELPPVVYRALLRMQDIGLFIAISTSNTLETLEYSTNRWHIQFDATLGYEGEDFQKGMTHLNWLADHFNLTLGEILFVGDSLEDYHLAKAAHVNFAAVLGSFTQKDFTALDPNIICVADIPELLKYLE